MNEFDTDNLNEELDYFRLNRSKRQIFSLVHHRAQMLIALRLIEQQPPLSLALVSAKIGGQVCRVLTKPIIRILEEQHKNIRYENFNHCTGLFFIFNYCF